MKAQLEDFQDMSVYGIEGAQREALIARHRECTLIWSTSDGWPVGVMHSYLWREGHFWVTCTAERKRVPALRRRSKSAIVVAGPEEQTVTAKTLATVHEPGNRHRAWFYPALAELLLPGQPEGVQQQGVDGFVKRLDTPTRVVLEFEPVKWISFDGRKVKAHASGSWQPGDAWNEPSDASAASAGST